ncbi:hypothetical protein JOQ06_018024 [Pogonophryne albipinna]|uniref:ZP domain-containing protein n=1 Tax=Pogonophryne albipinna TaxID=1090488 RepID=A0AAD6F870_9TELE|nr:hypothetical protein JOQ06_018024 [Pogonophryne albipinna]
MDNETHMVTFGFDSSNICGMEVVKNNSMILYRNAIMTRNMSEYGVITCHNQIQIDFSCLYKEPEIKSFAFRIKDSSVVQELTSGEWNYTLQMSAYLDQNLLYVVKPETELLLNQRIWLELKTEGLDGNRVSIVTDSCWATSQWSPNGSLSYDLINSGCTWCSKGKMVSHKQENYMSQDALCSGGTLKTPLSSADSLGPVWGVHIWHDNSGPSPSWNIKHLDVSETLFSFPLDPPRAGTSNTWTCPSPNYSCFNYSCSNNCGSNYSCFQNSRSDNCSPNYSCSHNCGPNYSCSNNCGPNYSCSHNWGPNYYCSNYSCSHNCGPNYCCSHNSRPNYCYSNYCSPNYSCSHNSCPNYCRSNYSCFHYSRSDNCSPNYCSSNYSCSHNCGPNYCSSNYSCSHNCVPNYCCSHNSRPNYCYSNYCSPNYSCYNYCCTHYSRSNKCSLNYSCSYNCCSHNCSPNYCCSHNSHPNYCYSNYCSPNYSCSYNCCSNNCGPNYC